MRQAQENSYKQRQQALMSRGVTREHTALLPRDPSEPMPSQIANDLKVHRREALRDEINRKMQRAVEAFENPWLVRTEKELQECTVKLNGSKIDHENRASVQAYRDVLQDKLKNFHCSGQLLLAEQITCIHPDKHLIRKNILQTSNLCVSERFEVIMLSSTMAGTKTK